jgi:hypothetical protein
MAFNEQKPEQEFQDLLKPWCSLAKVIAGFSYLALSTETPPWRNDWNTLGFLDRTEAYVFFGALACMFALLSAVLTSCFVSAIQHAENKDQMIGRIGGLKYYPIFLSISSFGFFGAAASIAAFGLMREYSTSNPLAVISSTVTLISIFMLAFVVAPYLKCSFRYNSNKVHDKHGVR